VLVRGGGFERRLGFWGGRGGVGICIFDQALGEYGGFHGGRARVAVVFLVLLFQLLARLAKAPGSGASILHLSS